MLHHRVKSVCSIYTHSHKFRISHYPHLYLVTLKSWRESYRPSERVMGNYRVCWCFTRKFKISEAEPPTDVKEAFKKYSDDGIHMTADQLRRFLEDYQGDNEHDSSISEAERIVEQILHKRHHLAKFINRKALSLEDFHHFLFSVDLNPPIRSQVSSI